MIILDRSNGSWLSRVRKKNPFQTSYWALYSVLDDVRSRLLLALGLLSAIAAGAPLPLIAVIFRGIIDSFPPEEDSLDRAVYEIVGVAFAYFIVTFTWSIVWGELGRRISQRLQSKLVKKTLGFDQAFFDVDPFDITNVLVSDVQTIQRGTSEKVGLFIQSCSYFVATFITGFVLNAALTGVLFAAIVPVIILITWTGSTLISKYSTKASKFVDQAACIAEGAIRCVLVVQAFDVADTLSNKHAHQLRQARQYATKKAIVGAAMLALVYWACYSLNALAFYWGSHLGGSPGTIYAVVFLILDASFVFNQVGPFIQTIALAAGASSKVFDLLQRQDNGISVYSDEGIQVNSHDLNYDIQFRDVEFSYPARPSHKVLDSVSFTIPGGKSTAVVGLSGSGKSTIAGLITRLYDPQRGNVTVGKHEISSLHLATFRSHIAVVQQSPVIFSGTIFENIRCGIVDSEDLSEDEVRLRCRVAAEDAHCNFIHDLQDGIDTFVSSSQGLSGGQRQRVCLARALVRKPALLILDEPTSALDSWSEQKIEESLNSIMQNTNTTIITIAHRLATIRNYSNIIVMGDGQILEQGCHDELLEQGKHYKALVEAQKIEQNVENETSPQVAHTTNMLGSTSSMNSAETMQATGQYRDDSDHGNTKPAQFAKVSDLQLLRYCFRLLRPEKWLLFAGVFAAVVQGAVVVGEAIVFGHLVSILNETRDRQLLIERVEFYCLMFFVIGLLALFTAAINGICFGFVSEAFVLRMRDTLLRTILTQDQSWFQESDHTTTKLVAGINQNSNNIAALSGPILQTIFATTSMIISGMILALISTPLVTIVAMSYIPAIMLSGYLRMKMLSLFNHRYSLANKDAAAVACEAVQNIRTVSSFGLERQLLQTYDSTLQTSYWRNFLVMSIGNIALSFSYSIIYFIYPLLYWWGSQQVRSGRYSQEQFFITLPAIVIASQQCGQFFTMAPEVTAARAAARQVFELLGIRPSIMTHKHDFLQSKKSLEEKRGPFTSSSPLHSNAHPTGNGIYLSGLSAVSSTTTVGASAPGGAEVIFNDVTFAYPTRPDTNVLQGVKLRVKSGQFVAFVGPSGAGKSSLIALLERFYDPSAGEVLVDGQDVRSLPAALHRSKLGLVPQEPELFAGSVSFNIALGAKAGEKVSQAQIEDVCKTCGMHDLISSLPDGYDTECGSQGSKLSGGQKQRIAIARALVRNPQILLLDEATASLDSHSEKDIQRAVNAASSHRTTIAVAHRLSTIQHADCIFVIDNGTLIAQGTHMELIQKSVLYKSMVEAQGLS